MGNRIEHGLMQNPQGVNNALLERLSAKGVKLGHIKELLRDDAKMERVSKNIIDTCGLSTSFKDAKIIMGDSFFVPEDVSSVDTNVPFPRSVLASVRSTHVLFWGNGLTVFDMSNKCPQYFFDDEPDPTLPSLALFEVPLAEKWHLVSKVPYPMTAGHKFSEQLKVIPKDRAVASVRQIAWMSILLAERDRNSLWKICEGGKFINCHEVYEETDVPSSPISIQFIGEPPVIDFVPTYADVRNHSIGVLTSVRPYV